MDSSRVGTVGTFMVNHCHGQVPHRNKLSHHLLHVRLHHITGYSNSALPSQDTRREAKRSCLLGVVVAVRLGAAAVAVVDPARGRHPEGAAEVVARALAVEVVGVHGVCEEGQSTHQGKRSSGGIRAIRGFSRKQAQSTGMIHTALYTNDS